MACTAVSARADNLSKAKGADWLLLSPRKEGDLPDTLKEDNTVQRRFRAPTIDAKNGVCGPRVYAFALPAENKHTRQVRTVGGRFLDLMLLLQPLEPSRTGLLRMPYPQTLSHPSITGLLL